MPGDAVLLPIFLATYACVAATRVPFLRIDRPAAALAGAIALLAVGLFTLEEAIHYVDWPVIAFLLGTMITVAYLELAGFFELAARWLLRVGRTPRGLLAWTLVTSAGLAAFCVNDTICLLFTPILLRATRTAGLAPLPYLLGLATAANIGSALTVTGNPQNMFLGVRSGIGFAHFMAVMAVPVLFGLLLDYAVLAWVYRKDLATRPLAPESVPLRPFDRVLGTKALFGLALTLGLFVLRDRFYPQAALLGGVFCLLTGRVHTREVWQRVDWSILLFFAGLFVVMGGFQKAGYLEGMLAHARPWLSDGGVSGHAALAAVAAGLSNLVSNVPAVILLAPLVEQLGGSESLWLVLALAATLAGNFTLIASVANLIVAEKAAAEGVRIGFFAYLRVGLPVSLATVGFGVFWLG